MTLSMFHTDPRRVELGAVYTPEILSRWLLAEVAKGGYRPSVVIDPAGGDGALVRAVREVFPFARTLAIDVDPEAYTGLQESGVDEIRIADALREGWGLTSEPTLVVANPPWGAHIDRAEFGSSFELAKGQFDSYDLFVEKIIKELPLGGRAAVFLPESLFLEQHVETRRLITERTTIESVTRLGEGLFPGVAMGCVAVIFTSGSPASGHLVRFSRLGKSERKHVLDGNSTIAAELTGRAHLVAQDSLNSRHDVPWHVDLVRLPRHSTMDSNLWKEWFTTGRGLELGKSGLMLRCLNCQHLMAAARNSAPRPCSFCGAAADDLHSVQIFTPFTLEAGHVAVAVGEDLHRHSVRPSRAMRTNIAGLAYKSELDAGVRLLVRKTGLGIQATAAEGIATTQTIYHFRPKESAPDFAVDFFAGLLGSRIMNAYHITRRGHVEWRSHPYVTQATIMAINIPGDPRRQDEYALMKEIAIAAKALRQDPKDERADAAIESSVATLMGGGRELIRDAVAILGSTTGSAYLANLARMPEGA